MALDENPTLGCGHSIDEVWATIDQPPTAHQASCEQCTAARGSLQHLQALTAGYHALEEQGDESLRPRSHVRAGILAVARAEVRKGRRIPVMTTELGPVLVSEQALLALIRLAADSVPGVRARRIVITPTTAQSPASAAAVASDEAWGLEEVTCRVAVSRTVLAHRAVAEVRERIVAVLSRHIAVRPDAVNITVEDIYDA